MTDMIERVGEAALKGLMDRMGVGDILEEVRNSDPETWREMVGESGRAAIEEMKNPTDAMVQAGIDEGEHKPGNWYPAMIDAALVENDGK